MPHPGAAPHHRIRLLPCACAVACAATLHGAESLQGVMGPGANFENLWLSLDDHPWQMERHELRAERATTGDPAHLLRISGLSFSIENAAQPFELMAASAVYDAHHGELSAAGGFHGRVWGHECQGHSLRGNIKHMRFHADGALELSAPGQPENTISGFASDSSLHDWSPPPMLISKPDAKSPIRLMQQFSGNIADFTRCMDRVFSTASGTVWRPVPSMLLISLAGGSLDLRQGVVELDGPAAVLGPSMLLFSNGGIRMAREEFDGAMLIRATGGRGLQGWLATSSSNQTWISAESFEWVNDGNVIQFTGGPLEFSRDGTILKATESWQYLRLFSTKRMVLSPGSWTTETDAAAENSEP